MTQPKLKLNEFTVRDCIDHAILTDKTTGQEFRIDSNGALFLRCIDGVKDIYEIREELSELLSYEVPTEVLFKALDTLSDIGILEQRLAPPASGQVTSRRGFLKAVSATAAASAAIVPQVSFGQSEQEQKSAEQQSKQNNEASAKQAQEQQYKANQEQNSKSGGGSQEENEKIAQEQNQKSGAEQQQKEQNQKVAAEQQVKTQAESSQKEAAVKASGGGGGGTATVPEPGVLTLLGLGLGSMALMRRRGSKRSEEKNPGEDQS